KQREALRRRDDLRIERQRYDRRRAERDARRSCDRRFRLAPDRPVERYFDHSREHRRPYDHLEFALGHRGEGHEFQSSGRPCFGRVYHGAYSIQSVRGGSPERERYDPLYERWNEKYGSDRARGNGFPNGDDARAGKYLYV